jgi:radical SAM protein with 4Fe4S-binding SPASM domain
MDHTTITSSPTFCPAPWTSLNIDQTGRVMPCFHTGHELGNIKRIPIQQVLVDEPLRDLRQTMARGEWHPGCSWCKRLEETTGSSGRTVRHADPETLTAIDNDPNFFKLEHLVVNWSNLCNLTCVYCNDQTSTAWQSVKKIPINHIKNEHADLIELVQSQGHNIQGLSLGGGEPLLQNGLDKFLNYINPDKVQVMVTTNLSMEITANPIYQILKTWPDVEWMISFDNANKEKFEYVRDGANWEQFVKNLKQMKQDGQHVIAHPAYSIYCALDLMEYYDFCTAEDLDIYWCELNHPIELDIRRHSKTLRDLAIEEIDRVIDKYGIHTNMAVNVLKNYRNTLEDNSYLQRHSEFSPVDTLTWHLNTEAILKKTTTFVDLWPVVAKEMK